eukprot:TRINITY_DN1705_c4_g1_i1.p1 TRINITY_DN1705_c4_g1~~TRINITY_DN1705_c4_g1_i1.p1  ORF type:complete len:366 (-),score=112.04 TRINITY_DN1705_c4_g1_i1:131-1228(-)
MEENNNNNEIENDKKDENNDNNTDIKLNIDKLSLNSDIEEKPKPPTLIVIGMAGSGKTTFMQRVCAELHMKKVPSYIINLDPAVYKVPYGINIDIRDTINYKEVMKQYGLGPNGAILTSLNLFSTRINQILDLVEKRSVDVDYILLDTPGQIEVFNWSASGNIITEAFASTFPTIVVYLIDTPRSTNHSTFMSNMLYACSMLYKTKLPMILVFNKCDIVSHDFAIDWMTDLDSFEEALETDSSYMSSLTRSMSLVLQEFYKNLRTVGVSSLTGAGIEDFFDAVDESVKEYNKDYKAEIERLIKLKEKEKKKKKQKEIEKLKKDMGLGKGKVLLGQSSSILDDDDDDDEQNNNNNNNNAIIIEEEK